MHGQHEGLHWHRVVHHADKIPVLFSFAFAMSTVLKNHTSAETTRKRPKTITSLCASKKPGCQIYNKSRQAKKLNTLF